jgi:small subunit ribosomal protein S1
MGKFPDIKWEEDDDDFGLTETQDKGGDFSQLLSEKGDEDDQIFRGEKVTGTVSLIPTDSRDILIDLGGKNSGVIDRQELSDEHGQLKVKVGDKVEAFVVSKKGGEIVLSHSMAQSVKSAEDLQNAFGEKRPVRGRVVKVNKGGFEVVVLGKTCFCPVSQIETRFVEDQQQYVGKELEFLIEEFGENGRNIVLSRSKLLKLQAEEKLKQLIAGLNSDTVLDGTVTEIRDFGAFVDIGGVEGLVHISELAHQRLERASDFVRRGEKVRVKVLKVERDDKGRPKIGLSMKAAMRDPWEDIHEHIKGSETYTGRVVRLMPFGAFVELKPGIEGLLHVSEMSWTKRVHHPSDVVKVGDMATVTVRDIDPVQKRISLTMKQIENDPWFQAADKFPVGRTITGKVERLKPFGAICELAEGVTGLVPISTIKRKYGEAYKNACVPGKELEVTVQNVSTSERKILLNLPGVEEEDADQKDFHEYLQAEKEKAAAVPKDESRTGSFGALLSAKLGKQ